MSVLVVIPARGGSKGVPGKNVASVGGVPLVARAVHAGRLRRRHGDGVHRRRPDRRRGERCGRVRHPASGRAGRRRGIQRIGPAARPGRTSQPHRAGRRGAGDGAVHQPVPDRLRDLRLRGGRRGRRRQWLTAAPSHGFLWQRDGAGDAVGVNHDKATRPRRQDRTPEFLETGAVYAMRADGFRRSRHRDSSAAPGSTDPARVLEIDEPDD